MGTSVTLAKPRSVYVTVRDGRSRRSKTITFRGERITVAQVVKLVRDAVEGKRQAGAA